VLQPDEAVGREEGAEHGEAAPEVAYSEAA
jgi:hypothetical protein